MKDIIISLKLKKDLTNIILSHLMYRWRLQATFLSMLLITIILGAITPYVLDHYFYAIGLDPVPVSGVKLFMVSTVYVICVISIFTYYALIGNHSKKGIKYVKEEFKYTINTWKVTRLLYKKTITNCISIRNRIACRLFDQCNVSTTRNKVKDRQYDHFVNEVIRATLFYIFTIYFEYQDRNLSLDDNGLKRLKNVYGNLDGKMISSFMDTKDFKNFYSTVLFEGDKESIDQDLYKKLFDRIYESVLEYIDKDYNFSNDEYKKEDVFELVDLTLENWCELFINLKKENTHA